MTTQRFEPEVDFQAHDDYLIVQCQGCRTIAFCNIYSDSEDYYHEGFQVTVFPRHKVGRKRLSGLQFVPANIRAVYEEALDALANDLIVLAGVGVRAVVEAICQHKEASGNTLKAKIASLHTIGVVTEDGSRILQSLRFMGNRAAHEIEAHSAEELRIAFDVVDYLLTGVYILPREAQKLPQEGSST